MSFDAITVGGGLAGSTLAAELAYAGHKILVLEKESRFKDRVRGENMLPWGVAAARRLSLTDALLVAGAHQPRFWNTYMAGKQVANRDLHSSTPQGEVSLNIYHPSMQEALLERAGAAGVEVKRSANVIGVHAESGRDPTVMFEHQGNEHSQSARVLIGADGRGSQVRPLCGFKIQRNPPLLNIAGMLLQRVGAPDDAVHLSFGRGCATLLAPLGDRRARMYYVYVGATERRNLSGNEKIAEFIELCRSTGLPGIVARRSEAGRAAR
jgi:2-polyprenyl-6-methoxyphenol hydroxylase-like FAD-dependent oxidoreductase